MSFTGPHLRPPADTFMYFEECPCGHEDDCHADIGDKIVCTQCVVVEVREERRQRKIDREKEIRCQVIEGVPAGTDVSFLLLQLDDTRRELVCALEALKECLDVLVELEAGWDENFPGLTAMQKARIAIGRPKKNP